REIRDVVRYKIHKMTKKLDDEIKKSQDNEIYVCEVCKKEFTILEVQSLVRNFAFYCDVCDVELVEDKNENDPHEMYCLMMKEIGHIVDMLREADKLDLPSVDYFQAIEMKNKIKSTVSKTEEKKEERNESEIIDDLGILDLADDKYLSYKIESEIELVAEEKNKTKSEKKSSASMEDKSPETLSGKEKAASIDDLIKIGDIFKKYHEITDEDKELMSEEEYEKYYEVFMKYNKL
ncbi:Transcription initiation factor IIE subunit alpha, partial [Dictyocoela roeselum]